MRALVRDHLAAAAGDEEEDNEEEKAEEEEEYDITFHAEERRSF